MVALQFLAQYNGLVDSDPICERIATNTLKAIEILRCFTECSPENQRAAQIALLLWFDTTGKLKQAVRLFGNSIRFFIDPTKHFFIDV